MSKNKADSYTGASAEAVKTAVEQLKTEAKDTNLGNYTDIKAAAEAVYTPMEKDLDTVVEEVKPWNNNQLADNPTVQPEDLRQETAKALSEVKEDEAKVEAVKGETLSQEVFAQYIIKNADTVGDYYKEDTYTPFGDHMALASKVTNDASAKAEGVSADDLAQQFANTAKLVNELPTQKEALRFDQDKLVKLYNDTEQAKNAWMYSQKQEGAIHFPTKQAASEQETTAVDHDKAVEAQASAANLGKWLLGNEYMTGGDQGTPTITDEKLKATEDNAKTMWKYIYQTMNTYNEYITTVHWDNAQQKYVKNTDQTEDSSESTNSAE